MRDLHGDGWNGNTLEVREADGSVVRGVTLGGGPTASTGLCLPSDGTLCLHVSVGAGESARR